MHCNNTGENTNSSHLILAKKPRSKQLGNGMSDSISTKACPVKEFENVQACLTPLKNTSKVFNKVQTSAPQHLIHISVALLSQVQLPMSAGMLPSQLASCNILQSFQE